MCVKSVYEKRVRFLWGILSVAVIVAMLTGCDNSSCSCGNDDVEDDKNEYGTIVVRNVDELADLYVYVFHPDYAKPDSQLVNKNMSVTFYVPPGIITVSSRVVVYNNKYSDAFQLSNNDLLKLYASRDRISEYDPNDPSRL